jgi:hypothetical protein
MPGRLAEIGECREAAPRIARINDCNQNAVPDRKGGRAAHDQEEADADLPILIDAKKEFERLK